MRDEARGGLMSSKEGKRTGASPGGRKAAKTPGSPSAGGLRFAPGWGTRCSNKESTCWTKSDPACHDEHRGDPAMHGPDLPLQPNKCFTKEKDRPEPSLSPLNADIARRLLHHQVTPAVSESLRPLKRFGWSPRMAYKLPGQADVFGQEPCPQVFQARPPVSV